MFLESPFNFDSHRDIFNLWIFKNVVTASGFFHPPKILFSVEIKIHNLLAQFNINVALCEIMFKFLNALKYIPFTVLKMLLNNSAKISIWFNEIAIKKCLNKL